MRSYSFKLRVYYEDTDAAGMVYHARYLAFAERARTEALRQAGVPHDELVTQFGLIFVVRRVEMDYLRPIRLDAEVIVETGPWALGAATVDVRQRFVLAGQTAAHMQVGLACVRAADGRPARIPPRWREALAE
ncbi:MAG TPA: YbgC/FadM family acyl-CoA thioesterase [Acetobacteraceae bacterium]|nr:YbgC/FadM family acyl-CoA thioesterase [Acetobacteraceae bacterium]